MGSSQSTTWHRRWMYHSTNTNNNVNNNDKYKYSGKGHNTALLLHQQQEARRRKQFDLQDLILVACGTLAGTLALLVLGSMIFCTRLWPRDFVPNFPFDTVKIWQQQDQYVTDKAWMKNWDALLGHDIGFVEVPHPARYGLTGGFPLNGSVITDERGRRIERQPGKESEAYCLSVMHQIHCLIMLKQSMSSSSPVDLTSKKGKHLNHCFDYLRQAVMCSADMSLEKARIDEQGKIELAVDGWGVEHKCRSWDAVETFATKQGFRTGRGGWKLEGQVLD